VPGPILVDTDVLVDFLRGGREAVDFVEANFNRIIISGIAVAELYAGVKAKQELETLDEVVSLFRVVPVTDAIARAAGIYKMRYQPSHGLGLADAIVAATAEAESADLATLNTRHFPMFDGLKPPYVKAVIR
jgi:predicted nucleic acid-binding protein